MSHTSLTKRAALRVGAVAASAAIVVGTSALPAAAHVTVTPVGETPAGGYAVLTFAWGHGCDGSPTTRIAIQIPEGINTASPTQVAGWTVQKKMEKLDPPVQDSHGNELTERVGQIVYTADTPLQDGYRAAMDVQVALPDTPGETLAFPVVQTCQQGETAWTQIPQEGQDPEELDTPAPEITVTEAVDEAVDEAADSETSTATESADSGDSGDSEDSGDGSTTLGIIGLAAGVIGMLLGGVALARTRRS